MAKIFIVIAAYNEEKKIGNVIKELLDHGYKDIVVVDDCSHDKTYSVASRYRVSVLRHVINRGQGAALKTGIEYALAHKADIIVTFDADGQHRVEDLPAMIRPVLSKKVDVTLGSRFLQKVDMPIIRRLTLKIGIMIMWIFYGVRMTDAHNGFRVMNRMAAQKIEITSDRMEHASQIVEEIHKKKLRYKEIPVIIRYTEYSLHHGQGSFWQGIKVFLRMIFRKFML